ncbi:uncharacterized protein [Eucyclogobius newberryi]|uniref:uncharacterized protein n=1 Tax=Eucyclogobius newberryi TaxID=166745 RepID=UPI003B5B3574
MADRRTNRSKNRRDGGPEDQDQDGTGTRNPMPGAEPLHHRALRSSGPPGPPGPPGHRRKLVLHIDLNNTVLVSDAVTGHGTVAALDGFLSGVTWGRMDKGQWRWLSDRPSLRPPCPGAVSFFSQFGRTPGFTSSSSGRRFRASLEEHLELLRWPDDAEADPDLSVRGEDGRLYHWILPSFFQLLIDLTSEGSDFAVVFRTFGTDLPRVLRAVSKVLTHGHPLFSNLRQVKLGVDMSPGKIRCSGRGVVLTRAQDRVSSVGREDGARMLYTIFSSAQGISGFQDHFDWWAAHSFSLIGGKPFWIDPFDLDVHHIFIDDNIRPKDQDSIVHPMVFLSSGGTETRSSSSSELLDLCLVQNDLLQAISDPQYFTQRVQTCAANYQRNQGPPGPRVQSPGPESRP